MRNSSNKILDGFDPSAIDRAATSLRNDQLVAIPTETVYGLAARASSPSAIAKIFEVKKRPKNHPLILHIADKNDLGKWSQNISDSARALTTNFWPGPLTVVVKRNSSVSDLITGNRDTVAIRCPAHSVTTALLAALDDAIVAPSANRFGKVSPTNAGHVLSDLGDDIDLILDGGDCKIGLESTIIDCTTEPPQLLRAGALTVEQIKAVCGIDIADAQGESRAPGMLEKHYAPKCRVELVETHIQALDRKNALDKLNVSNTILYYGDDLELYAKSLYAQFRQADASNIDVVIAVVPPMRGIGAAICERLKKASF